MRKWIQNQQFHKTGFRLLKLAHSLDTTFLPLYLLRSILQVGSVYVYLILNAALIDALLTTRFERGLLIAGIIIVIHFILGCISQVLGKLYTKKGVKYEFLFYKIMHMKALSLDYETMEDPQMAEKIAYSERTASMYGGLFELLHQYLGMLDDILTILFSAAMVVALCFHTPLSGEGWFYRLANPLESFFLLLLLVIGVQIVFSERVNQLFTEEGQKIFSEHTDVELRVNYWMRTFMEPKLSKLIRIFAMQDMLLANAKQGTGEIRAYYGKSEDLVRRHRIYAGAVNSIYMVGTYLLVVLKVLTGAITVGAFTQYVGALSRFGSAFSGLLGKNTSIRNVCTYMKEFLEFMDAENIHPSGSIPVEKRADGEYEFVFENVSFRYPGSQEYVLQSVNCKLNTKDKMAVVGRNGAGKTTFIKLLCRLYVPTEGRITLNGVDIQKYDEEEYRDLLSVVFQDFKLFAFPVWENIVTGYKREDEKLRTVLKQAGVEDVVEKMPQGIDSILLKEKEEGVDISGGEAQKLAIARALYKDAPFVILDEPTAALDPISEAGIYARFDEMVKDKTAIYISHRMSSCRFCNDIIVFDRGRIVERGSHETLLEKNGQYAEMWNAQAKYYV